MIAKKKAKMGGQGYVTTKAEKDAALAAKEQKLKERKD